MTLSRNQIHNGDCIAGMQELPEGSVDLVFADPPFNIGYKYDVYDDRMAVDEYLQWSREWIQQTWRVLKPDGTFWLAIGDDFAAELKLAAQEIGYRCRSWVIWYYTFGVNCRNKFTRSHTHLFHFVKDPTTFTFRADDPENRVPSARMLVYGDKRGNPKGRLPDDTWIIPPNIEQTFILRPQDADGCFRPEESDWYFPRVAGTFRERAGFHGCQMPEQLLGRIIRTCSEEGELVLDPFSGSASTLVTAKKLGRQFIGFELSPEYTEFGTERLEQTAVGDELVGDKERTMGAPRTSRGRRSRVGEAWESGTEPEADAVPIRQRIESTLHAAVIQAREEAGAENAAAVAEDSDLQEQFARNCRNYGLTGSAEEWLELLVAAEKAIDSARGRKESRRTRKPKTAKKKQATLFGAGQ